MTRWTMITRAKCDDNASSDDEFGDDVGDENGSG
jgi:hypothetical protein